MKKTTEWPRERTCKRCGAAYLVYAKGCSRYCGEECRRQAKQAAERARTQKRRQTAQNRLRPKHDMEEIRLLANEAVEQGTTYGKYVARLWLEEKKGARK